MCVYVNNMLQAVLSTEQVTPYKLRWYKKAIKLLIAIAVSLLA